MQSLCRFERARLLFSQCAASLAPATRLASTQNVPAGHHNSDLSSTACNISLGRRRDISLRQDLTVHVDGKPAKLSDVFKGTNSLVIGLPDCGNVCKTKHLPGFVDRMQELVDAGFPSVVVASVTTPEKLQGFLEDAGAVACGIKGLADTSGGFTRMLGLEINNPGTTPPYSQRYVAFVQDGTLVRLCIEKGPVDVDKANVDSALQVISGLFK